MNKPTASYAPPPKETPATVRDVITVKKALGALLVEETQYMDTMQIAKIGELQDRKLKLTGLLERYTRYLHKHQDLVSGASAEDKAELQATAKTFYGAMRQNYDTLLVARAVNQTIVKCVTSVVISKDNNPVYNARGGMGHIVAKPISVTLNQTI